MTSRQQNTGFSLIELMVVVVILAVVVTVALPAYQGYVARANQAMAQSYLLDVAQMQQLYFNDTRSYASAADAEDLDWDIPERVTANYGVAFNISTVIPLRFEIVAIPSNCGAPTDGESYIDDVACDGELYIDNENNRLRDDEPW